MRSARKSRVLRQRRSSICWVRRWSANCRKWPAMLFLAGGRAGSMCQAQKTRMSSMTRSAGIAQPPSSLNVPITSAGPGAISRS
eukprot:6432916-Pyramimonas_sp.AAC.1